MAFLSHIPAVRGFLCESNLRRGISHGKLVTGNPGGTIQSVAHKIHVRRAFLFFCRSHSLFLSSLGKQAEMALCRASLLYRFLYLQLGICRTSFCFDCLYFFSKKIEPINCAYCSFVRCSVCDALLRFSRNL